PGNWNDDNNWNPDMPAANDNATIQHHMILNTNITINNNRTYTVTESGSITDPIGGSSYGISVNGMLLVDGNVSIEGNFTAGGLHVHAYDTLIVGNTSFSGTNVTIDEFGVMIINGD